EKRIRRYIPFEIIEIPEFKRNKSSSVYTQREAEGRKLIKYIDKSDYSILLDKKGKELDSVEFSVYIQKLMNKSLSAVYFFTGGVDGFCEEVYARTNDLLSLSKMTFTHQMARLIFIEQLYRALAILKGDPYHH
ncbi:MAG: 23S rRNA (pseudouridine(1915)-N(3))-methyltransferase RlmH, partial [Bacteroidales bacterium]